MNCESGGNPFQNMPVDSFKPPRKAKATDVLQWQNLVKAMMKKIGDLKIGGDALRVILNEESMKLELKRLDLFCQYLAPQ